MKLINIILLPCMLCALSACFAHNNAPGDEIEGQIIFYRFGLFAMSPSGGDEKIIDEDAWHFLVSPDGRRLIVFTEDTLRGSRTHVRLYDLKKGIVFFLEFPQGDWDWGGGWWSENSQEFLVSTAKDQHGNPFSSLPQPVGAVVNQLAVFNVDRNTIRILENFNSNPMPIGEFQKKYKPANQKEFLSHDRKHKLFLKNVAPRFEELHITSSENEVTDQLIFKSDHSKFGLIVNVTNFAWAPTDEYFVLDKFEGFSIFTDFSNTYLKEIGQKQKLGYSIYLVNKDNLLWTKLTDNGMCAHWLKEIPSNFEKRRTPVPWE